MGIKDLFSRQSKADGDDSPQDQRVPSGDEPGASSTQYDDGEGTIGLKDRLGGAAPAANQAKAEPMPPTASHTDPAGAGPHTTPPQVPDLDDMGAGGADAQVASPTQLAAAVSPASPNAAPAGLATPSPSAGSGSAPSGTAHRAPGLQGEVPAGESLDSDTSLGATRMEPGRAPDRTSNPVEAPGDTQGVSMPHGIDAPGTSEEQGIAHGVKDPAGAPPVDQPRSAAD